LLVRVSRRMDGKVKVDQANAVGAVEGQVTPFWLETSDQERLFCWHVLPLDVYLEHERELVSRVQDDVVGSGEFESTLGARLLREDAGSKLVVNFHGVSNVYGPRGLLSKSTRGCYMLTDTCCRTQATSRSAGGPPSTAP
jgi:hypothetical protein